ncbi:DUF1538 domain-containing protein [Thiothrix nivea]|uniref:DUF1538 domain-containing protein n=1 Tax=Thiothrix nivea (strain ATCC 35100 / DSM 5205 / JP2) TaxID=870187 RepID=A0A656HDX0_THINJ|nr:DUF1538 domain-containing protein [Thiothrix nivea]EIJ34174.1 protein of unknown function DUF1538 [Thiothrix nivea DSM 5205]
MATEIRFGSFLREITVQQERISYNSLTPKPWRDGDGAIIPYQAPRIHLRWIDAYRLITPYISKRLLEQVRAVIPLALYLVLFQIFILQQGIADASLISGGLVAVILGLMFFMEGLQVGLMPLGETIGNTLPAKSTLRVVLGIAFILGIGVTFAEPAIGALKAAGQTVQVESAPYLYAMLNSWAEILVLGVGIGVGAAAVLGTLRLLNGWSLKPLIYASLLPVIGLTAYMETDPELQKTLGLAWDSGAVTTGPVTVPLVLALGIGIASAAGRGRTSLSGFGIVTLASLFPILSVQLLAVYLSLAYTPADIIAAASHASRMASEPGWFQQTPYLEIISGLRAIVPLVLFLLIVMWLVLKEKIQHANQIAYGIILALLGMVVFNLGLSFGLTRLGAQAGSLIPAAFMAIEDVLHSPLYSTVLGLTLAFVFAWVLGFGATQAEPALNTLGLTVENLTNGAFRKATLVRAVSAGVAFGLALGVAKIVFGLPLAWLLVPGYLLAAILTFFSSEEFVNIAWDSAGVTTGPITVPLVLAMGLGFGKAVEAIEGFGILSMASICPILSVLLTGLWIRWQVSRKQRYHD